MLKVYRLSIKDALAIDAVGASFPRRHQRNAGSAEGLIITAQSEAVAREMATLHGLHDEWWWTDPALTDCEEISLAGAPRVLMRAEADF